MFGIKAAGWPGTLLREWTQSLPSDSTVASLPSTARMAIALPPDPAIHG
jgi:hypothetical protein